MSVGSFIQLVMQNQILRITHHTLFDCSKVKVKDRLKRQEVADLQLNAQVVVIFSVSEGYQIVEDS